MAINLSKFSIPKLNKSQLIKVIVAVVALAGLVMLVTAVVTHYQAKQQTQITQQNAEIQAREDERKALQRKLELTTKAYDSQRLNCERGAALYNVTLTPAQKRLIKADAVPTCGPAVLQF